MQTVKFDAGPVGSSQMFHPAGTVRQGTGRIVNANVVSAGKQRAYPINIARGRSASP
ncbi:MAG: hypothetical protein JWQ00_963 [Noviherbaspirillum sp.]|jgi:hypothetical protein|nr:hypothetical protein [Noviherbaspirillum sp.]